jgi:uncharacterized protein YecT (DUF1311 family)
VKRSIWIATALATMSGFAQADAGDDSAKSVVAKAEREVWTQYVDDQLFGARSIFERCRSRASARYEESNCLSTYADGVDAVLKDVYESSLRLLKFNSAPKGLLQARRNAQESWVKFRKDECWAVRTAFGEGNGGPDGQSSCNVSLALQRVQMLMNEN